MVFSSLEFLFLFFAVSILVYYAVPMKWRNAVLLTVSLLFYGWGEPVYIVLMLFSTVVDYTHGLKVEKNLNKGKKKRALGWVIASAVINLSLLGFFKYSDFLIENINSLFGTDIGLLNLPLPIGISFYTFQTMSYTIDIYRGDAKAQKNILNFGAYVTLFPQLIAGPIVRYKDIDDQLRERPHNLMMLSSGVRTFICGFAKKVLLANAAGAVWDSLRGTDAALGAWLGIIFYSFQIYFDFSGYSDMAIGLGKMMGFTFLENFYYPYVSESITDFWRRWHISLGTWFREYVYIPLGGNRKGTLRTYFNIFTVWLLTGFWHGASWNYVLWGLYYCVILVIEKAFLLKKLKKAPKVLRHVYSLILILFGWWLFVFEDLGAGIEHLKIMLGGSGVFTNAAVNLTLVSNLVLLLILAVASTPYPKKLFYRLYEKSAAWRWAFALIGPAVLIICIAYLVNSSYNPFLYFRF